LSLFKTYHVTYNIVLNAKAKSGHCNAPQLAEDILQTMLENFNKKTKQTMSKHAT
jgi:hypothetical protein